MTRIGRLFVLASTLMAMTSAASAQVVPDRQGLFGSIDGRWMWLGGDPLAQTGNGPGGQMMLGYKISDNWDIALAGDVQGLMTEVTKLRNGTLSVDTNHQHFDLEAGFSDRWSRVNAGLRGIHYMEVATYNVIGFAGYDAREMYGIGPKLGAGARWAVSDNWAIVGGANAALLYTFYNDSGNAMLMNRGAYNQLVPQLDGELGLSWRSSDQPLLSFTGGIRASSSFNTSIDGDNAAHQGTLFEYGPFVRVAYNMSGPSRAPVAAEPAPATAAAPGGYLVFFDFDRSDLSPVASGLIRQAADDARRGRPANIQVTGHADRAGSDEYNRALSLRRANTVKAELVRLGLSDAQISVLGRGEGDPLVPTADGIREARNRRVQISF